MVVGRNRRVGNTALHPGFGRNTLRFPAERHTARLNSNDVLPLQTQLSGQVTHHTPGGGGGVLVSMASRQQPQRISGPWREY